MKNPADFPLRIQLEEDESAGQKLLKERMRECAKREFRVRVEASDRRRKWARFVAWLAVIPFVGMFVSLFLDDSIGIFILATCWILICALLLSSVRIGRVREWGVRINLRTSKDFDDE